MTLTDVEASFYRYLYENLEINNSVKVIEDITMQDFEGLSKWVVIDTLTGTGTDAQPKQHWFLHVACQKFGEHTKEELIKLVDLVHSFVEKGIGIPVYNYGTGALLGQMLISETGLSPVYPHFSGGIFRSLTVSIVYLGN